MLDPITTLSQFPFVSKKILITGGKGFLGSNITKKAKKLGYQVDIISRHSRTPYQQMLNFNPDVVIHCAWDGGNNYKSVNSSIQYENVTKGIQLIKDINKLPTPTKFIGFGSFAEYGKLTSKAIESNQENPLNLYGLSKYMFKEYSKMLCSKYDIEWGWVRPCYVYGPGDVSTRLIPTVINKLLNNQQIELDKCDKLIDYIYIDDFVNLVLSLVEPPIKGVYNICSGEQYELKNIIQTISNILKVPHKVTFSSLSTKELTSALICGDNSKILAHNKFPSLVPLDLGLKNTINYYKNK